MCMQLVTCGWVITLPLLEFSTCQVHCRASHMVVDECKTLQGMYISWLLDPEVVDPKVRTVSNTPAYASMSDDLSTPVEQHGYPKL